MDLLKNYLTSLRDKRSYGAGTKETSFYPCLVNLLDAASASLKPKVQCLSILQNTGAGNPDGGLFDKTQMQKGGHEPRPGAVPSRGVVEVKGTRDDAWFTADTPQVSKYWQHYGQVLVCFISNYSWLDGLSFTGMREKYLEAFDRIWVDCLNGDKYKTGKLTPEGEPDPSVFSTSHNREGIQVGTAIATLVRVGAQPQREVLLSTLSPRGRGQGEGERVGATPRRDSEASERGVGEGLRALPSSSRHHPGRGQSPAPTEENRPVHFRHLWGKAKLAMLAGDAAKPETPAYEKSDPPLGLGLPFIPATVSAGYLACPRLPELFPVSFPGVKTSRDDFLVDIDREALRDRLTLYFDPAIGHEEMRRRFPFVMTSTARFKAEEIRDALRKRGFLQENLVRYCYRPLDVRWLYWEPETKLLDEKRPDYFPHVFEGNLWLSASQRNRKEDFYQPQYMALLADHHIVESNAGLFPLFLREAPTDARQECLAHSPQKGLDFGGPAVGTPPSARGVRGGGAAPTEETGWVQGRSAAPARRGTPAGTVNRPGNAALLSGSLHPANREIGDPGGVAPPGTHPNLSPAASAYLESMGAEPEDLFFHVLAVMHAPAYRAENAGALRQDWPRIPLPSAKETLVSSAVLGRQVAALLDTERDAPDVTSGAIRSELKAIGILSIRQAQTGAPVPPRNPNGLSSFGAPGASPGAGADLPVTAGWGHGGKGGVTMPGKGALKRRPFTAPELAALGEAAARLGGAALDVYLNDTTFFANVPEAVWDYTLGGYQVLKKWLSYREHALLGRPLKDDEARHFMHTARRIAALILLQPSLDANYRDVKANPWEVRKM